MGDERRTTIRAAVLLAWVIVAVIGACSTPVAPAPAIDGGGPVGEANSFDPDETIWIGTGILDVTSTGSVVLEDLTAVGLPSSVGAEPYLMYIQGSEGGLGIFPDDAVPAANRNNMRGLVGTTVTGADGSFEGLLRITLPEGGLEVSGFVLRYRQGGSSTESVFIPHSAHVCTPRGAPCTPFPPHP